MSEDVVYITYWGMFNKMSYNVPNSEGVYLLSGVKVFLGAVTRGHLTFTRIRVLVLTRSMSINDSYHLRFHLDLEIGSR